MGSPAGEEAKKLWAIQTLFFIGKGSRFLWTVVFGTVVRFIAENQAPILITGLQRFAVIKSAILSSEMAFAETAGESLESGNMSFDFRAAWHGELLWLFK